MAPSSIRFVATGPAGGRYPAQTELSLGSVSQSQTSSLAALLDQLEGKVSREILEEVRNFAFVVETSPRDELPLLLVQLEVLVSITSDRIESAVEKGELPATALDLLRRKSLRRKSVRP